MSTGLIIALIVIVAVVVVVAAVLAVRARNRPGGQNLKRRFGPEYDRTVARHDGDTKAAERELADRVERHGDLRVRPLEPAERDRFETRWAAVQEHFVDSPREAVTEADALLSDVAGALGFPDGGQYEEQLAALSVHHGHHVHGYRRIHRAAQGAPEAGRDATATGGDTEDLRAALLEARELFDELLNAGHGDPNRQRAAVGSAPSRADAAAHADDGRTTPRTDH
ncbi:hypothetical protein [Streptomyces sp. SID10815]|uniref:Secreted protein n=1 Tax=Streptomyces similanensis TaxID=1274988 RepID=A0ABP9KJE4_9ACTN|nr:hypothetical protein [Streptomyces sp. SID10815]NEA44969.1 hypothetical protein [Streptomyces sp. SID10815]QKW27321.1 hypothetical protein HUT11_15250 [Streptomyces seoulensis]